MSAVIDKVAWIHLVDGSILSTRSQGKDTYYLPGGKRELGESDVETLVREVREELDVDIKPETATYIGIFEAQAHGHAKGVTVRMACYMADYVGVLRPASEIAEIVWLRARDSARVSDVDRRVFAFLVDQGRLA